ncbi:MAG: methyltransferase type 12 [Gammaproteobacteria bacterium]|nr:methyltransferase type 12 [Gammaproteobacteria bacterium]|tara:strand:+ start:110 stop:883 length:774 start_codon:yes stop_codon:yes gene_type:complete
MTTTINEVKKFWDDRPCNIRHSSKELGTIEYFDEVSKKKFHVEPHILDFTTFPEWKGKKVLEIGCGLATVGINFALNGASYTGVELSDESLKIARQRFDVYGTDGRFFSGNAEHLSTYVPVETYDLIYSFGVIHHSPHPEKILSEIKNYMNKDSTLKIMLYAKDSWKNYMIDAGLDQPEAQYGCPIANTYTKDEVVELLDGYDIISIEQDHIFPYQIEPYKKGEYIKQPWFESMPDEMFRSLEKNLGWHLLITAKLK